MAYLLGLDIGTTGAKAVLIDGDGEVLASATSEYPLSTPKPLWSEQDPEDWWQGTIKAIYQVTQTAGIDPLAISGVGLSGQMHGLVLLDEKGKVLRPAILWNDQRTGAQCEAITEAVGFAKLLDQTGNPVLPGFTAPKITWVRENEPDVYNQVSYFLLPKDYVRYRLTGELATDVSDASGTSLFDVKARTWSTEMFHALEIPTSWAPPCFESQEAVGNVIPAAADTGLAVGTVVVGGAGDQAAQAIGTGLAQEGLVSATLGTSGVVFAPTEKPLIDSKGRLHSFCHGIPGMWHVMGVMLSAAGSLRWFRDVIGSNAESYEQLIAEAKEAPAGCEGLIFLPYLSGERTPHPDPNARGAFVGLTLRHDRSHMIRSVLEGVAFGLCDSMDLIREQGILPGQVRVSGGGAKSELWLQILADTFGVEVATMNLSEGAALGAAILAGVGTAVFDSVIDACEKAIKVESVVLPKEENAAMYKERHEQYRQLYPALSPTFQSLSPTDEV